ncbi:MAG: nucleotidyltransferase family protein [Thaumarchaeota archaeon]|nr:nucleotidyltransferase family protein [Nitrososphaerota archaeon]
MKAVILAGGKGLRFRPLTDDKPKAMIAVNGKPIAEYQLEWLKRSSVDLGEIIFACGHKWEKLEEHFGNQYQGTPVSYVVEKDALGTGGGLKNVLRSTDRQEDSYLVLNGDILTDLPVDKMLNTHLSQGTIVTMALIPYRSPFGVVRIDKLKMVRKFEEKPEFVDAWVNGGIYLINGASIEKFLPDDGDIERETFPKLVERGEISSYPYYGFWRALDSIKDLKTVETELVPLVSESPIKRT